MVFATGQAVGAPLGGYLADTIGWRWSFILQVPLAILAIISVSLALKLPSIGNQHFIAKLKRVDFGGALTLVTAIFCLLLGLDRGGNISWNDRITIISLSTFGALFFVFLCIELRFATEPFAPKRIVVNPSLIASYLCNFFCNGAGITQVFMITLYFQAVQGRTAAEAGLVLLPSILAAVLGSLIGGLVMQATGKYYWLTAGVFLMMVVGQMTVPAFSGVWFYSYIGITVGAGITTTLIALIANAGSQDQAVATAGETLFAISFIKDYPVKMWMSDEQIIQKVRESLTYIGELEPSVQAKVIASYADAVIIVQRYTVVLAVCALVSSFFIKEKALTR
ncbi:hypothetical protein PHLCEN_2v5160 [Hermanssonia centrifuga]|uniref:Major facilitator superfamily (MFS) profile domain-containing protein n=1 Tax=Hermanssonia centrifuga TaxID=98765 RepID=A0A2R6P9A3_9APHY|nr:hypothetical protein PHLCEN_2v5160 [Hermanssonia centrifuga]